LRLVAGGWFVLREKYCWLVADKPSEQAPELEYACACFSQARTQDLEVLVWNVNCYYIWNKYM
jgi:hypothetical protein